MFDRSRYWLKTRFSRPSWFRKSTRAAWLFVPETLSKSQIEQLQTFLRFYDEFDETYITGGEAVSFEEAKTLTIRTDRYGEFVKILNAIEPHAVLAFDTEIPQRLKSLVNFAKIPIFEEPWPAISEKQIDNIEKSVAEQDKLRKTIASKLEPSRIVFCSVVNSYDLDDFISAFREARLQSPDLVLAISGAIEFNSRYFPSEFDIQPYQNDSLAWQKADIILLDASADLTTWISVGVATMLGLADSQDRALAEDAILLASSLVLYDPEFSANDPFSHLAAIGAVWVANSAEGLANALTQAVLPERAALTSTQALDFWCPSDDPMQMVFERAYEQANRL